MDRGMYISSHLLILFGIIGTWLSLYSNISDSFKELAGVSILLIVLGLMTLPVALLKNGPPNLKQLSPTAGVLIIGVILIGLPIFTGPPRVVESGRIINITLISTEWAFNQTNPTIQVELGDRVRITLINNGTITHSIEVVGLGPPSPKINPGENITIEFVATKEGTFDYICPIPGHAEFGMHGKFIVTSGTK